MAVKMQMDNLIIASFSKQAPIKFYHNNNWIANSKTPQIHPSSISNKNSRQMQTSVKPQTCTQWDRERIFSSNLFAH